MDMSFGHFFKIFWLSFFSLTLAGIFLAIFFAKLNFSLNWSTASRASANIAPLPRAYKDAVVQVYAARAFDWRGLFSVHTWIATKTKGADTYMVYQVLGWRSFFGQTPLFTQTDIPDRMWFGHMPMLLRDVRGKAAEKIVAKMDQVVQEYPWPKHYILWPGPNSNTFTAYVARKIPELHFAMPPVAVGKDYLGAWRFFAIAPSGTGFQISFFGVLGVLLAKDEGLEIDVCGLTFGINFKKIAIALPAMGYIGFNK